MEHYRSGAAPYAMRIAGIKSAVVNSRQDVFRRFSPLGSAPEKVATAQPLPAC